jgi:predicted O-methyltransferase YrrM
MLAQEERNQQVKKYICDCFCQESEELIYIRNHSAELGLQDIAVPPNVGKMLYLLARLQNPKRILEIGVLGGYSTLWLAKALAPGGELIALECDKRHAEVAKSHLERAGVVKSVEILLGSAAGLLEQMIQNQEPPFDLIFIDADKENYSLYLDFAIALSRSGTLILCDNLIPKRGEIASPDLLDNEAVCIYAFNERLAKDPRLESLPFPTIVGEKGRVDALGVSRVR